MQRMIDDVKSIARTIKPRASAVQQSPYRDMVAYEPAQYRDMDDDEYYQQDIQDGADAQVIQTVQGTKGAQRKYTFEELLKIEGVNIGTIHDTFWHWVGLFVVIGCSIGVWLALGYGNGMVFSGLRGWDGNRLYFLFGFGAEAIVMYAIYKSVKCWREDKIAEAWVATGFTVALCIASFVVQSVYIFGSAAHDEYDLFTHILIQMGMGIPSAWILYARAIFFTLASIALVLFLPEKKMDIKGALRKQEAEEEALSQLYIGRAMLEQRKNVADTMTLLLRQQNAGFGQVSNALTQGHDVYVQHSEPKLLVEHVTESERVPQKKQPVRTPKPLPESKPIPFPQRRQSAQTPTGTLTDSEVREKVQLIMAKSPDALLSDIQQILKTRGVAPERTKYAYDQMQKAVPEPNPLQKLDRDVLTKAQTTRMPEPDLEIEDLGDDDSEMATQFPLA